MTESLTIVIVTYNRPGQLANLLGDVENIFPFAEVLVAINGSTSGYDYLKGLEKVKTVVARENNPAASKNLCTRLSTGNWILYLDDDDRINLGASNVLWPSEKDGNFLYFLDCFVGEERLTPEAIITRRQLQHSNCAGNSYLVSRDFVNKNSIKWNEDLGACIDYDYLVNVIQFTSELRRLDNYVVMVDRDPAIGRISTKITLPIYRIKFYLINWRFFGFRRVGLNIFKSLLIELPKKIFKRVL